MSTHSVLITYPRDAGRLRPGAASLRHLEWLVAFITAAALVVGAVELLHRSVVSAPPLVASPDLAGLLFDRTRVTVLFTIGKQQVPWDTTAHDIRANPGLWHRMHLVEWNSVAEPLRRQGLDRMLERYRSLLVNPHAWRRMKASDWDAVPQPMRVIAYRAMVDYWSAHYDLGRRYGLTRRGVADTLAAIVMAESWFDHRGSHVNADGSRDIGLGGASDFARERLRELRTHKRVDAAFADDVYNNPYVATQAGALWLSLMLEEARGNLDLAIRAYHRGIVNATDGDGSAYLATVHRLRSRFIQNRHAPPAWDYLWHRSRDLERGGSSWGGIGQDLADGRREARREPSR